jgi:stearoyl-CoA desaturase (delta-9 desaturase)
MEDKRAGRINWSTAIAMVVFHVGAVAALFFWSWQALVAFVVTAWVAGSLGIGMGYHRLLTHRGYKAPKLVEYFLSVCGTIALEAGPISWVATHRIHHAHSDREGDPHTPRDGRWWAHMGWILRGTAQQHDEATLWRYTPDLMRDPFHRLLNRFHYVPLILLAGLLYAAGGWGAVMWGVFLRTTVGLHMTWLVNSATHMWGSRRFKTEDDSRNTWWVALVTWGEGWHNNHHAHPVSAKHGLAWYEIDVNWWGIRALQFMRLAKAVKYIDIDGAPVRRRRDAAGAADEDNTAPLGLKDNYEGA